MATRDSIRFSLWSILLGGVVALLLGASCGQEEMQEAPPARAARVEARSQALVQEEVCIDGDAACTPTGAHARHGQFACAVCHAVAGRLSFQRTGPAYGTGLTPTFNASTKACSNVACHGVPYGSYSYYFPGGDGEPVYNTVTYGGTGSGATPSWYATGSATCTACHGNPPRNGSSGSNIWHSGYHGGQGPSGANNQCQLCHPDATSTNGVATGLTRPALHGDGYVEVTAVFKTGCIGCH